MNAMNRWIASVCLAGACASSFASPLPLEMLNSVGTWESSLNGMDGWVQAVGVENPFTTPVAVHNVYDGQGRPNGTVWRRDQPLGQFMWHPDVNGVRPVQAWFRLTFTLHSLGSDYIGAWLAADDYAEMTLNGVKVRNYLLDNSKDSDGQPIPGWASLNQSTGLKTKFDPWGDGVGLNTLVIRAQNGDANRAYNRELAWVLVDGYNIGEIGPNGQVYPEIVDGFALVSSSRLPEPDGFTLALLALVAAALSSRVSRRA